MMKIEHDIKFRKPNKEEIEVDMMYDLLDEIVFNINITKDEVFSMIDNEIIEIFGSPLDRSLGKESVCRAFVKLNSMRIFRFDNCQRITLYYSPGIMYINLYINEYFTKKKKE